MRVQSNSANFSQCTDFENSHIELHKPRTTAPGDQRDRFGRFPHRQTLLKTKILITVIQNFRRACSDYEIFTSRISAELFRLRTRRVFPVLLTCRACFVNLQNKKFRIRYIAKNLQSYSGRASENEFRPKF